VILVDHRGYGAIPDCDSADLPHAAVSFHDEQVTCLEQNTLQFGATNADLLDLIERERVRVYVGDS